jgi:hypothetical protein|tara:strand:- start:31 stop:681 length:651 start_codon:yes stop_codon:yes gene_type:complete
MYSRENTSEEYKHLLREYEEFHKNIKYFNGLCLANHINKITKVIFKEGAKSLLDYGCGKALLYNDLDYNKLAINESNSLVLDKPLPEHWQLDFYSLYDPAYPKYNKLPKGKYDAVLCTDVIEHIDEKDVDWILEEVFSYGKKFIFLTIACYKALKTFKDGRNVHVNIKTPEYWTDKLLKLHDKHSHLNIHYSLDVLKDEKAEKPVSITEWKLIERK